METIVVGIDGSKGAQVAARWAATQANERDARVIAVYAIPRTELWSMSAVQINIDQVLAEFRALLDGQWTASLRKADVKYTTQVVRGDPATELLRAAKRANASLLVLGSKSHGSLADMIVGGTVHKVINRSTLPVVLVPSSRPEKKRTAIGKARLNPTRRFSRCRPASPRQQVRTDGMGEDLASGRRRRLTAGTSRLHKPSPAPIRNASAVVHRSSMEQETPFEVVLVHLDG